MDLELAEWQIERISDSHYVSDSKTKTALISGNGLACGIPLYENDMNLLRAILNCGSEDDITGRKITAVSKDGLIKAVGSQGLYIPLYYRDNSSRILPEHELCELLCCFNIVRFNKDDEVIASYEVPRKDTNSRIKPDQLVRKKYN